MYFREMKIGGNSFWILLLLYFLGYTHFLGGPYGLARFFFMLILVGTLAFFLILWAIARFAKKVIKNQINNFNNQNNQTEENNETIKVDVKIIE